MPITRKTDGWPSLRTDTGVHHHLETAIAFDLEQVIDMVWNRCPSSLEYANNGDLSPMELNNGDLSTFALNNGDLSTIALNNGDLSPMELNNGDLSAIELNNGEIWP